MRKCVEQLIVNKILLFSCPKYYNQYLFLYYYQPFLFHPFCGRELRCGWLVITIVQSRFGFFLELFTLIIQNWPIINSLSNDVAIFTKWRLSGIVTGGYFSWLLDTNGRNIVPQIRIIVGKMFKFIWSVFLGTKLIQSPLIYLAIY